MRHRKKWLLGGISFALLLALAFGLHGLLGDARASACRTTCVHNLKLLSLPLKTYAEEHEGRFPDKLSELYFASSPEQNDYLKGILICPELGAEYKWRHGVWTPGTPHPLSPEPTPEEVDALSCYALVPGLRLSDEKDTVIAYEKGDNHSGTGRSILLLDGRALWDESWQQ
jgi:hypothetical protein